MASSLWSALVLCLVFFPGSLLRVDEAAQVDEAFLREAHVDTDGPALAAFLRQRTPSDADLRRAEKRIDQLGSSVFEEREAATRELVRFGSPLVPLLEKATRSSDAEVRRRATRCLEEIRDGPGPELTAAVVRQLVRRRCDDSVPVLLDFMPFAVDRQVEQEVFDGLLLLSDHGKKPDPLLVTALDDPKPLKRAAAAFVLGRSPDEARRAAVRKRLTDADAQVRFAAARGLLVAHEWDVIPVLVDLLPIAPSELAWQVDEVLRSVARDRSPGIGLGDGSPAARKKWHDAWAAWWQSDGALATLLAPEETPRTLGLTLCVQFNTNRVLEYSPDGKVRWTINVTGPMDAEVLPGARVLIAERTGKRVTERDLQGNILWEKQIDTAAINCKRLPNGNTFIGTDKGILEVARDGGVVKSLTLNHSYLNAVRRTREGHYLTISGTGELSEFDQNGKEIRKIQLPNGGNGRWLDVEPLPGSRYLVSNGGTGKLCEVDFQGKIIWDKDVPNACGIERLPGGRTLVGAGPRVLVVDHEGKTLWDVSTGAPGFNRRAHRR